MKTMKGKTMDAKIYLLQEKANGLERAKDKAHRNFISGLVAVIIGLLMLFAGLVWLGIFLLAIGFLTSVTGWLKQESAKYDILTIQNEIAEYLGEG